MPTDAEPPYLPQNSTPPAGLVVLPSGLVVYEFKGVISAEGVTLPEAANNEAPASLNAVEWLAGGLVMEDVFGGGDGAHAFLNLRANWQQHRESGIAKLEAVSGGGILCRLIVSAEPAVQGISAQIGTEGVSLINGLGGSSFPQLTEGGAKRLLTMAADVILLNGAGESQFARLSAARKQIDWGIVTALPATTNVGDTCIYKAATGIYWSLVYTGEATYPWAKIGGPPLRAEAEGEVKTASTGFVALAGGPELSAPLAGEYDIETRSFMTASNGNSSQEYSYSIGGAEPVAADSNLIYTQGLAKNGSRERRKPLTKGQAVAARYRSNIATMEATFKWRELYLDPVRVG